MEPDDDEHDGDDAVGPLLPPDDRIWRHPSEVFAAGFPGSGAAMGLTTASRRDSHTPWLIAVVSGLAGAFVVVSIIGMTVGFGSDGPARPGVVTATLPALLATTAPTTVAALTSAAPKPEIPSAAAAAMTTVRDTSGAVIGAGVSIGGGYVLTAAAVVNAVQAKGSANIERAGTGLDVRVLGASDYLGVGLLQIDDDEAASAPMGSVISIGPSTAISILTSTGPANARLVSSESEMGSLYPMLSFTADMAIDAGAAVLDENGNVIGIVTGANDRDGNALAIPIDIAKPSAVRIMSGNSADCGWLGVHGHSENGGVKLDAVTPGSPAERAGLKVGDRIVVMGNSKATIKLLGLLVRSHGPGETMRFTVVRGDETLYIDVTLAPRV